MSALSGEPAAAYGSATSSVLRQTSPLRSLTLAVWACAAIPEVITSAPASATAPEMKWCVMAAVLSPRGSDDPLFAA